MQREIERLASGAAWPARAAVPPTAQAVVFADEAELLACVASDLIAFRVSSRWWWRLLVRELADTPPAVARAFVESAEHAPAALAQLARRREAARFLRALRAPDIAAVGAAVARAFSVPVLVALTGPAGALRPTRSALAGHSMPATPAPRPEAPWAT